MKEKLRIGVLLDSYEVPAWIYKMMEEILTSPACSVVLVVKNKAAETKPATGFLKKLIDNRKTILHSFYTKLDIRFQKSSPDAFAPKDISGILKAPTIEVEPKLTKHCDYINDTDIEKINEYKVDIFIRLGFRILKGKILNASRYGVWSYHHGDSKVNRGGPAGFWEVIEKWPETGVVLQILSESLDGGKILFKSWSLTHELSPNRNRNSIYWKAMNFLPYKINELYNLGADEFFKRVAHDNQHPRFYSNRLYTSPTNAEMLTRVTKLFLAKLRSKFFVRQWGLFYKMGEPGTVSTVLYQFKKIDQPKDRIWADPHIVYRNDQYYIFFEEMLFSKNKGHISLIIIDSKGKATQPVTVLEKDYHLSYPFTFEDKGELYMIPETSANNTVELYKCVEFPHKWELEKVLLNNIFTVDTTILHKDGKYWLFTNMRKTEGASTLDELFLFYADELVTDKWIPHPENPVVSDIKKARPAGNFFTFNQNLYRPGQNSSGHYGYGISINHVKNISTTEYREELVDTILPSWQKNIKSVHTINSVNKLTVIDAEIQRSIFKIW